MDNSDMEKDKIWVLELIWSEKDMSESKMKPRLRAEDDIIVER